MHNNKHRAPAHTMNSKPIGQTLALAALLLGVFLNTQSVAAATASRTSGFVYDPASGLLIKEIIEPGDPNLCLVTEYAYDTYGNKTSITTRNCNGTVGEAAAPAAGSDAVIAPRTTTSTYTYNADGSLTNVTSNALGHSESKTFEPKFGNVVSLTGPNNLTTSWTYDNWGRKTLETRADGTTTAWSYVWGNGGVTSTQSPVKYYITTTVSGQANPAYDYYDSLSRKVLSAHRNFANTDWIDEGNVVFDNAGRVIKSYLSYERAAFAGTKFSTVSYDAIGRAVSQTSPDGSVATTSYDGLTIVDTNSLGQTKTAIKNIIGKVVTITDHQGNALSYTYDPFGNLVVTSDAVGNVTRLTYDIRGRKTGMSDPDMGSWVYGYDVLGELVRQVDAKGQTVTMTYDKLGRMLSRNEPDLISAWVYDTAANGKGKLASSSSNNGYSRTHTYDALGRPLSTATIADVATPYVTSVTYDGFGRVLTQTYPTGFAVKNVYNADGYLTQVVNAATGAVLWAANSMDTMGHLTQQTYGNGVITTQVFDPATGKLKQQLAGVGNALQNTSYTYDSLGNLTTKTDAVNNLTETYTYDNLNRILTAASLSGAVNTLNSYSYNAIGNIVAQSKKDVTANTFIYNYAYTYNASGPASIRPHAVSAITGTVYGVANPVYTYDANGSMLTGAGRSVTWTSFNMPAQMVGCPNGGAACSTVGFTYNPEHERVKETQADGSVVITLSPRYDTGLHFEKKYITANNVPTGEIEYEHYLYAGGMMFGKYITTTAANGVTIATTATEYYIKDHLGSIVAITDQTGAVTQRLSFDVFGKRRYPNGAADPNGLLNNPDMYHGYTGHEMLDAVGLIHMNGRIFDPAIGRFLSADFMIPDTGGLQHYNRYSYVINNPFIYTDPNGQCPICIGALIGALVAGAKSNWDPGAMLQGAVIGALGGVAYGAGAALAGGNAFLAGVYGGAASGFVTGLAAGGNLQSAFRGGLSGAITGGAGSYFGDTYSLSRVAVESLAGGVSAVVQGRKFSEGFKSGFVFAAFTYIAASARAYENKQSQQVPGQVAEGPSYLGTSGKTAGERINLDEWKRQMGDTKFDPNSATFMDDLKVYVSKVYENKDKSFMTGLMGGFQGGERKFFGMSYSAGGFIDQVAETFSGFHDAANHPWFYNSNGTSHDFLNGALGKFGNAVGEVVNAVNVLIAAPVAVAALTPSYMRWMTTTNYSWK